MTERRPLVIVNGQIQQLQAGDTICGAVDVPQTIISHTNASGVESIETTDDIWKLNAGALTGSKISSGTKITCRKGGVDKVYTFSKDIDLGTLPANTTHYVVLEVNSGSENKSILANSDVTVHLLSYPMYWKELPSGNILISKNNMTSGSDGGYTVSASSSYNASEVPYKACDGLIPLADYNGWSSQVGANNQWWKLQLPSSKICGKVVIYPRYNRITEAPKDFTIEGSNDDTNWTTLGTFTGETSWGVGVGNEYSLNNTTAYLYYRVNISTNNGGEKISFAEIEFYEVPINVFHYNGRDCFIGDVADFSDPTNAKTCIMLGELTTDATEVTDVVTYAFNGKYYTEDLTIGATAGSTTTVTHNLGTRPRPNGIAFYGKCTSNNANYVAGEYIQISSKTSGYLTLERPFVNLTNKNLIVKTGSQGWWAMATNGQEVALDETKWKLVAEVKREDVA